MSALTVAHHPTTPDDPGFPARVGVWAADPLTRTALALEVRRSTGAATTTRDLADCDVLVVAEDEDGTQARFAAARATADRAFPVVWVRNSPGRRLPQADVVVAVVDRSEVGTAQFSAALRRAAELTRDDHLELTGGNPSTGPLHLVPDPGTPENPETSGTPGTSENRENPGDRLSGLTARDVEVLRLLAAGESTTSIAERLFYSDRTVTNLIHRLVQRIGAKNRSQAVALAVRAGLA